MTTPPTLSRYKTILKCLEELQSSVKANRWYDNYGICAICGIPTNDPYFVSMFESWRYYSGDCMYPVPCKFDWLCPLTWLLLSPYMCYRKINKWKGQQRKLRINLIDHMVSLMKHDIETGEILLHCTE